MTYDLAILGGGPGGISAGIYACRKRLKTVFITDTFEGQSAVSVGIQNWIGEIEIPGAELALKMKKHLLAYAADTLDIKEGERGQQIIRHEENGQVFFEIKTAKNSYLAKTVLVSTGSVRRKLDIPGAAEYENKGVVYCASCDGPLFADMDVTVVGGGNAAFETVAQLLAYCKSVTLLNRSSDFRADPITVAKVTKNPKLTVITNAITKEIFGEKFVNRISYIDALTSTDHEIPTKGVFVEIGLIPNTSFLKDIVELDSYGHIVIDPRTQSSKTPGIWAAGDCTDVLYHQNNIAAGDGVRALEDIYLHLHTR